MNALPFRLNRELCETKKQVRANRPQSRRVRRYKETLVTFETEVDDSSERALELFVGKARRAVGLRGNVNVAVTTNRVMRNWNRRFRGKDKTTDVLSFPVLLDPGLGLHGAPLNFAGDIAISGPIAAENGRKLGHGTVVELKVLVLHGLLHLAGYDHEGDHGEMARKEERLRRELGLPDGLIERAENTQPGGRSGEGGEIRSARRKR